ncbi:hypothetical protein H8699_10185 [Christensenellaceae bacterium NSJ-44]|uniref:Uncharacterized protein n=1 Tax=Luoshenia tenuis TaxID=2763654 RepID=A0A926D221_9FIRM|nr:hypothetical protein [Luoshenia tenuis]MBC8529796.1 hypothetical protein [Luoshenia tenuis]
MKKALLSLIFLTCLAALALTGCANFSTYVCYTYQLDNGDAVEVELDTTDGYTFSPDLPFFVKKDGHVLSRGAIITADEYDAYLQAVQADPTATILDSGKGDGIRYTFYAYGEAEFDHLILISGSETGILLANPNSQEEAQACFERLTFRPAQP